MENAIIPKLFNSVLTAAPRDHSAILPIYTPRINNADGMVVPNMSFFPLQCA